MEKYRITSGKAPVIISSVMLILFGGLYIWLKMNDNGAMLFAGFLTLVMALVLILTVFRLLYYKVIIYEDGFFYQTTPFDGRHIYFTSVIRAWVSQGEAQSGSTQNYLNISLADETIRIPFLYKDKKAVKYFISKAKLSEKAIDTYTIDGKLMGKTRIAISIVLLLLIIMLEAVSISTIGFNIMNAVGLLLALSVVAYTLFSYHVFKVEIKTDGFYYNKDFYKYEDMLDCREIKKVVHLRTRRYGNKRAYYFFFEFTLKSGKSHRFLFEKPVHQHEIEILTQRIRSSK